MRPASFALSDMSLQGDAYILRVREEAGKIVQEAKSQAEQVRRNAEKAGRLAAEQAISQLLDEKVGKQMQTLLPALDSMVEQLDASRSEWADRWEQSAIQLAVAVAERILKQELKQDPQIALTWVQDALELAAGATELTVRLSPADHANLGNQIQTMVESMGRVADTRIVEDASIVGGGCLVQTKYGEVDLRLSTQLDRLEEELV